MEPSSKDDFGSLIELFQKIPFLEGVESNLYTGLHIMSQILLIVKENRLFESGWGATITLPDGSTAFTAEEGAEFEKLVSKAEPILAEFCDKMPTKQTGGGQADELADQIVTLASHAVDPEKISVDNLYFGLTNYLDKLDDQNRSLARQIGPVAFTSELKVDPFIPNPLQAIGIPPPKFQIPARSILPISNAVLELLRLLVVVSPIQLPFIRNMLSVGMAVFDVLRGEWKYGLFSLMGILGNKPLVLGVLFKIIRDAWMLIEPNLADELRLNMFKAGKSMIVGFWLWAFATFAPDFIRNPLEAGVGPFRALVDQINESVDGFQEQANASAEPLGVRVTFPTVPTDIVPSFADIQNLQTLVQQPEIYCSAPVKALLEPIKVIPPLRFVLEMLNVPLLPELQAEACKGIDPDNLSGELAKRLMPQIDIIPGGPAAQAIEAGQTVSSAVGEAQGLLSGGTEGLLGRAKGLLQNKADGVLGGLAEKVDGVSGILDASIPNSIPVASPEPAAVPEPTPEPTPEATPEAAPAPVPTTEATPEAVPEAAPASEATPEPEAVPEAASTPKPEPEPEPAATSEPAAISEPEPAAISEPEPVPEPEPAPEPTTEATSEAAPEPTTEAAPEPTIEATPEAAPAPAPEPAPVPESVPAPEQASSRKLSFSEMKSRGSSLLSSAKDSTLGYGRKVKDSAYTQKALELGRQAKDSKAGQVTIKYAPTVIQATTGVPVKNLMEFHKNLKEARAQEQPDLPPVKRFSKEGLKRAATSPTARVVLKHAPTLIQSTTGVPIKTAIDVGKKASALVPQSAKDAAAAKTASAYSSLKGRFTKKAQQGGLRRSRKRRLTSS